MDTHSSRLTFEPVTHTYWHDGVVVPSVTQVLDRAGLYSFGGVSREVMERAGALGRAVHEACHMDDENDLDEAALDPVLLGYLEAWRSFRAEKIDTIIAIERRVYHEKHRFAGTFDRLAVLKAAKQEEWLLDLKSGTRQRAAGPQTAAYANAHGKPHIKRASVHLNFDGTWSLLPHRGLSDWTVFLAALTIVNWRDK